MGGFLGALRGGLAGVNSAAGNTETAAALEAANQRARDEKTAELRMRIGPHGIAIKGLQQKLATIDPQKNPTEYQATVDEIQNNVHAMREILHPDAKLGAGDWLKTHTTDRLHITNHDKRVREVAAKNAAGAKQDEEAAQGIATGTLPYYQTPEFLAKKAEKEQEIEGRIKEAEARLSAGGWTRNGSPIKVDGQWYQPFVNKLGETMMNAMPEGYNGPNAKAVKGTLVRSKQSPTGWAQTWVDPYNPGKIVGWQPGTAPRYQQAIQSKSTTTDPFGVTSSTNRVTEPVSTGEMDLSGLPQVDEQGSPVAAQSPQSSPGASPSAAPPPAAQPAGPKTQQLKKVRAGASQPAAQAAPGAQGSRQLDENGHIPESAGNKYLVQAANDLLDGKAQKDLQIPPKDKQAAAELASQYGYMGEGMWTPREKMQVDQSQQLIDSLRNDDDFMSVFDEGAVKRAVIQSAIDKSKATGIKNNLEKALINQGLSDKDIKFVQSYQQLIGRIQSIAMLTRGSGRPTEAAVNRMMQELPNILTAKTQDEANHAFDLIQNEMDIGMGKKKGGGPKTQKLKQTKQNVQQNGVIVVSPEEMQQAGPR